VQDGIIDTLSEFRGGRPGPLRATERFLKSTDMFELDQERAERFLISHHPKGWLRRKGSPAAPRRPDVSDRRNAAVLAGKV
jgi:cephalosporin hydroxylase